MTLQERVEYCSEHLGIKKGHIAKCTGTNQSILSSWLHGRLILNSWQEQRIEKYISSIEKIESYLSVK